MNKHTTAVIQNASNATITAIGIDLAKNLFAVHGADASGKPVLVRPSVRREQLLELLAQLPACLIGMEACSGAHHWARQLQALGHTPKLMAPKFVTPYRMAGKQGKNDANDAAAICEAVTRANMRFVPIKTADAQASLSLHRVRQGLRNAPPPSTVSAVCCPSLAWYYRSRPIACDGEPAWPWRHYPTGPIAP